MLVANGIATGSASRASRARVGAHAFVAGAAWLVLVLLWVWQIHAKHVPADWLQAVSFVAGGCFVLGAFCAFWVIWNRRIYRKRHNRRAPIVADIQFERDGLGRAIVVGHGARDAQHVVVAIDETTEAKHYNAAAR